MKKITTSARILLLFTALSTGAYAQQKTVVIKGTVVGDTRGYDRIDMYSRNPDRYDSMTVTNKSFSGEVPFEAPYRQLFASLYDSRVRGGYAPQAILIDKPGTYHVVARIDSNGTHYSSTDGAAQQVYAAFTDEMDKTFDGIEATMKQKYGADVMKSLYSKNPNVAAAAEMEAMEKAAMEKLVRHYVSKNPGSYASAVILQRNSGSLDNKTLTMLYQQLTPAIKALREGEAVKTEIAARKLSVNGATPADFTLKNELEKAVKLSDYKGKYVLIDFWASWCGPCRAAFPHMRELYAQYKDKNFEILSISTDRDKAAWLKALKDENNPWPQMHDDKGEVSKNTFNVQVLPTLFLLDPKGKIIAQKLEGEALDKKLKALLP
ncbi:TlpA family protein disulfide reductase [Chitinophaga varians]|uniref:TlpA family protein disulfide reductase n=1 Tax=Chitinophaga varians TaxID=2202339 RepID=UPI00165F00B2|nr:TlpA disulfide reductase family protein [Chitinophaga varians]MBC9910110.1 TlpA family protein disulfide reductase [Chitinophaga varians]